MKQCSRLHRLLVCLLFFTSGLAGLVYEVLWMRELGLLFGNTAQAASTTLATFFLGLVTGARFWGRQAASWKQPLRGYAFLEIGVALSAVAYFFLVDAYHVLYAPLYQLIGDQVVLFLGVKFLLALVALMPASFFMGGTLPMMSEYLVSQPQRLGRTVSLLYGVNTLGAGAGAYLAGFHLPLWLGFNGSYFAAIATTLLVAVLAWLLSAFPGGARLEPSTPQNASPAGVGQISFRQLMWIAFFSGFGALSLEVLWTRMFAQVFQNSIYTFSTILVSFLAALALGAALASYLIRRAEDSAMVLLTLLTVSGLLIGATPFVFHWWSDGLDYLSGHVGLSTHGTFLSAFGVMLVPALFLGSVYPFLMRLAEPYSRGIGRTVGDLTAVNTVGAVTGSLIAGFFMLETFGLWSSIRLVAVGYVLTGLLVSRWWKPEFKRRQAAPFVCLVLLVSVFDPSRLPVVRVDAQKEGESLLGVWESSAAVVSVIRRRDGLSIKMDNGYSLGGTGAVLSEARQAHLPLLLHPKPDSVFFLGMGTGITAGAVLSHPVKRVVVCELVRDVVRAAGTFFRPYLNGLFEDPRVTVITEDGRNVLASTDEKFDVIIADLFMPWKAGVGNLYSREHYEAAKGRLQERGLYAQWLPAFQLSERELGIVARTMMEVFPRVTLWRGTIEAGWETLLLVGHVEKHPLEPHALEQRLVQSEEGAEDVPFEEKAEGTDRRLQAKDFLLRYCGNLTQAADLFAHDQINTDNRPLIEYQAPLTHLQGDSTPGVWLVGQRLVSFLEQLLEATPISADTHLQEFSPAERQAVGAGLSLQRARLLARTGDEEGSWRAMQRFRSLYAGKDLSEPPPSELEQTRRELQELINTYEERIRALREHLREAEAEAAGQAGRPPF